MRFALPLAGCLAATNACVNHEFDRVGMSDVPREPPRPGVMRSLQEALIDETGTLLLRTSGAGLVRLDLRSGACHTVIADAVAVAESPLGAIALVPVGDEEFAVIDVRRASRITPVLRLRHGSSHIALSWWRDQPIVFVPHDYYWLEHQHWSAGALTSFQFPRGGLSLESTGQQVYIAQDAGEWGGAFAVLSDDGREVRLDPRAMTVVGPDPHTANCVIASSEDSALNLEFPFFRDPVMHVIRACTGRPPEQVFEGEYIGSVAVTRTGIWILTSKGAATIEQPTEFREFVWETMCGVKIARVRGTPTEGPVLVRYARGSERPVRIARYVRHPL